MARNTLRLDTSGFTEMLKKLDELGGDVQRAVQHALEKSAQTIRLDTEKAMAKANLPASGKYSFGTTKDAIVQDTRVRWEGQIGWVPVGFDFSEPGAGGFLISGTPRMKPNAELKKIYKQKRYMNQIQNDMGEIIMDYIVEKMEE